MKSYLNQARVEGIVSLQFEKSGEFSYMLHNDHYSNVVDISTEKVAESSYRLSKVTANAASKTLLASKCEEPKNEDRFKDLVDFFRRNDVKMAIAAR
jgi:hypothetical protein